MKLVNASISNYRSIKSQVVELDPSCRVLVGINESGKSNVLNALATLSPNYKPSKSDERQLLGDENLGGESFIKFRFMLEKTDYEFIRDELNKTIFAGPRARILEHDGNSLTVYGFVKTFSELQYKVDIPGEKKFGQYFTYDEEYMMTEGWYKVTAKCPDEFDYETSDRQVIKLSTQKLINLNAESLAKIPEEYVVKASADDFTKIVHSALTSYVTNNLPQVIFWEFTEKDLLPSHINLSKFVEDPKQFLPLNNMFNLAGIENIPETIKTEQAKGHTRLNNLLKKVHESATDYLAEVWKEYKGVRFTLQMDGLKIRCNISEENDYEFKDRSDGFKKFIAFLLSISSTSYTGKLRNALILIDEPEIGLHPSGARYFRDELLKVARHNQVVYSTHSIFMIDRHDISRHYIVNKERETTTLTTGNEGNIVDEEVIFNAINYSTFEHLKEVNVLFEGWCDKRLFKKYISRNNKQYWDGIGVVHGNGAPSFRSLVPTLEAAERKGVIVSDNDRAAKDNQKNYNEWGHDVEWLTYKQISKSSTAITGEDFIKNPVIVKALKDVSKSESTEFVLTASSLPDHDKLKYIKGRLLSDGREDDEVNKIIKSLKTKMFSELKYENIDNSYKKLVDELKVYIDKKLSNT